MPAVIADLGTLKRLKVSVVGGGLAGLYFALLAKKAKPRWEITVYERNRSGDASPIGLVLTQPALDALKTHDATSYERIRHRLVHFADVEVVYKKQALRSTGDRLWACARSTLLNTFHDRSRELGVEMKFGHQAKGLEDFGDSNLIVVADGMDSRIREHHKDHFRPSTDVRPNKFTWLASSKPLGGFKYLFRETPQGVVLAHSFPHDAQQSTWTIEMDETTWRNLGLDRMGEAEMLPILQRVFAEDLEGHSLVGQQAAWRNFPIITTKTWVKGNAVLVGDAKATTHFAMGSGVTQAMQDATALLERLTKDDTALEAALANYDSGRHEDIARLRHAANGSLARFEHLKRYWAMEPEQFAFSLLSVSKETTWEKLESRDPVFVGGVRKWFADKVRAQRFDIDPSNPPMPMFTPFRVRDLVLDNRVVVSPMDQYSATDGLPNDWHMVHIGSRAIGGAGLVFVEMTCPSPEARISPGCTGLWNEAQRDAFKRIVDFCHSNSRAKIGMQLGHAGRKGSTQVSWKRIDQPLPEGNWPLMSSSPLPYYEGISQVPREMTRTDMDKVVADFRKATVYADQAGFDILEIHMAHGYLFASFISPLTNQRNDEYGGPIENRMRFPLEVFRACRQVWPDGKPTAVRISTTDWMPGGLSETDLIALTRMLKDAGCDLIDCSAGQTVANQKTPYGPAYQSPFSDLVRHEVGIPTIAVGAITTPDEVNTLLAAGRADLVALARPHLNDPYFTLHAAVRYQHTAQHWPPQYLFGRGQVMRMPRTPRGGDVTTKRKETQPTA